MSSNFILFVVNIFVVNIFIVNIFIVNIFVVNIFIVNIFIVNIFIVNKFYIWKYYRRIQFIKEVKVKWIFSYLPFVLSQYHVAISRFLSVILLYQTSSFQSLFSSQFLSQPLVEYFLVIWWFSSQFHFYLFSYFITWQLFIINLIVFNSKNFILIIVLS